MPSIRTMYSTGSGVVVNVPKIYRELCGLMAGASAEVDIHTQRSLLLSMGVAEAVVSQMELSDEQFITVRRYHG